MPSLFNPITAKKVSNDILNKSLHIKPKKKNSRKQLEERK
jgi:hypothetical protein